MSRRSILLFIIAFSMSSCSRPEGKDPSKADPLSSNISDSTKVTLPTVSPVNPGNSVIPLPSTDVMPEMPQSSDPNRLTPVGSVPILRPQQLAEFHPKLPDFLLSKVKEVDEKTEAQSIILFRARTDTSRTIKSTIIDINERGSSKLVKEISQIQKAGHETRIVEGESITSYYTEIKGLPSIKSYIPSKTVATLYILVGDHRAVILREYKVSSPDHLIEAAKTIDFKKFETLSRN